MPGNSIGQRLVLTYRKMVGILRNNGTMGQDWYLADAHRIAIREVEGLAADST